MTNPLPEPTPERASWPVSASPASEPLSKRDEILWASAEEIVERGFSAASLANIAQRLGLTKGALTYHFPTKNGISAALIDESVRVLNTADTVTRRICPERGLSAVVVFQLLLGLEIAARPHVSAALAVFSDVNAPQSHVRELLGAWHGILNDYLERAQRDGDIDPTLSVEDAGEFLVIMSLGHYQYYSRAQVPEREPRLGNYRLALRGLGVANADAVVDQAIESVRNGLGSLPRSGTLGQVPDATSRQYSGRFSAR